MVVEPPQGVTEDEPASTNQHVKLTIKSLKPALTFSLEAPPTATISSLKAVLAQQDPSAPAPEAQRWLLKGKSMGDGKLLKEFPVEDGSVVTLMTAKVAAPVPSPELVPVPTPILEAASGLAPPPAVSPRPSPPSTPVRGSSHRSVPSLTISTDLSPSTSSTGVPFHESISNDKSHFDTVIASPDLWTDAMEVLRKHFGDESEAHRAWEAWLSGSVGFMTASEKALIRSKVGLSSMGGV